MCADRTADGSGPIARQVEHLILQIAAVHVDRESVGRMISFVLRECSTRGRDRSGLHRDGEARMDPIQAQILKAQELEQASRENQRRAAEKAAGELAMRQRLEAETAAEAAANMASARREAERQAQTARNLGNW